MNNNINLKKKKKKKSESDNKIQLNNNQLVFRNQNLKLILLKRDICFIDKKIN